MKNLWLFYDFKIRRHSAMEAPRGPNMTPIRPKMAPKRPRRGPRQPQERPKRATGRLWMALARPTRAPRGPQERQQEGPRSDVGPNLAHIHLQEAPGALPDSSGLLPGTSRTSRGALLGRIRTLSDGPWEAKNNRNMIFHIRCHSAMEAPRSPNMTPIRPKMALKRPRRSPKRAAGRLRIALARPTRAPRGPQERQQEGPRSDIGPNMAHILLHEAPGALPDSSGLLPGPSRTSRGAFFGAPRRSPNALRRSLGGKKQ